MTKILEVKILDIQPDWNNSDLPAGAYLCSGVLFLYFGDKGYPTSISTDVRLVNILKDTPSVDGVVIASPREISIDDFIRLVTVVRADPANLITNVVVK